MSCRTPPGILCLGHLKLLRAGEGPRAYRQRNSTTENDGSDDRSPQNLSKPTKIENTQKCIKIYLIESCKQLSQKLKTPYENAQNKQFCRQNAFLRANSRIPLVGMRLIPLSCLCGKHQSKQAASLACLLVIFYSFTCCQRRPGQVMDC